MAVSPLAAPDLPSDTWHGMTPESLVTLPAGWQPGLIRTRAWLASTHSPAPDRPQHSKSLPGFPPKPREFIG